jgi:hypothetical protein
LSIAFTSPSSSRNRANSGSTKALIFLLALFPIVPMPIAGGIPIQLALVSVIYVLVFASRQKILVDKTGLKFIGLGVLLLVLEILSAIMHQSNKDVLYVLARGLWIITSFAVVLTVTPWIRQGRIDIIAQVLATGLAILLGAMFLESAFYPQWSVGRQLGVINLPFPRSTGVPNSDGKLGTFLVISLTFYLFVRPDVPLWQRLALQFGPWIGLMFTQSRSTLLALVSVYTFFWIVKLFNNRSAVNMMIRWFGLLIGLVVVIVVGGKIYSALLGEGIYQRNVDVRFDLVDYGIEQVQQAPIIGNGAGAIKAEEDGAGVHNTPLAMSVKSGLISGITIFALITFPIWGIVRNGRRRAYAIATALGVTIEHMLYPGFINEFLVFAVLVPQLVYSQPRWGTGEML